MSITPTIRIDPSNGRITEGDTGSQQATFTVSLSESSTSTVTVGYATSNSSAKSGLDYTETSGVITFSPGETSKTFDVPILGDTSYEASEIFKVSLSNPTNGTLDLSGSVIKGYKGL